MAASQNQGVKIAKSPDFQNRIEYSLFLVAQEVLSEALTTAHHIERIAYARRVIGMEGTQPPSVYVAALSVIVGNLNLLDPNDPQHGVSDPQVEAGVRSNWNDLAGAEQGT